MHLILGYIFAVITAGCWTHNSLAYSWTGKRVGSSTVTHIRLWAAFPGVLLINLIYSGTPVPTGIAGDSLLYIVLSGLLGFFVADLFIFKAFQHMGARKTMVIMTLSPILGALISSITLGEILSAAQAAGIAVTIGGVITVILVEEKKTGEKASISLILTALAGALTQAAGMVLAKAGVSEGLNPVSANVARIGSGLAGIAVYTAIKGSFVPDFKKMKDTKSLVLIVQAALIGPVFGMLLTLYALSWAPVGIVTTLMQLTPVMLLPVDRFYYKKKIPAPAVWGTMAAVAGAALLFIA